MKHNCQLQRIYNISQLDEIRSEHAIKQLRQVNRERSILLQEYARLLVQRRLFIFQELNLVVLSPPL